MRCSFSLEELYHLRDYFGYAMAQLEEYEPSKIEEKILMKLSKYILRASTSLKS